MEDRLFASRFTRWVALALPVAAATLAFAPVSGADAATVAPTIYTPTTTAELQSDISTIDGAAPGTLSIIQLAGGTTYTLSQQVTLNGDVEIVGPTELQVPSDANGLDAEINGSTVYNTDVNTPVPLIEITSGSVLFKGIDIVSGGIAPDAAVQVDPGASFEADNTGFSGDLGPSVSTEGAGSEATLTNDSLVGGIADGVEQDGTGTITLINDTIAYNSTGALIGPGISIYNTYIYKNDGTGGTTCVNTGGDVFAGDYADTSGSTAATCGTTGITVTNTNITTKTAQSNFNGGPTITVQLKTGNAAIGKGLAQYCPTADQRFFLYTPGTGGTCDVGSYQTTGVQDTSTTGPTCAVASTFESSSASTPSTQTVDVAEPAGSIGLGPDAVLTTTLVNSAGGTVSTPTVGSTWFNAVDPSFTIDTDYPAVGPYAVTASKALGDLTSGDTMWSFYASDWLGNTTLCK